ncbi:hypothetical protein RDWZM_010287 [Blomia tropicalis]|uniref:F-box domain-containing protein n=1 Tax=Blomia tropicalis TaxID=40697 RepID=A0A9Q0M0P9_BLOTA|nr:hypothetical protein RDWZM_010287 [Blomia tropicalis]
MAEITKFYTTIRGTKLAKQIVAKSSFGNFQSLPNEMFVEILRHLSIDDLGILSMTSSKIRAFIISTFILSPNGIRKLNNYQCLNLKTLSINYISIIFDKLVNEIPQSIGYFLKRCTFVLPTKIRIHLLEHIFEQTFGAPMLKVFENFNYPVARLVFKSYSKIINCFVSGWCDFEIYKVYDFLYEICAINRLIETVHVFTVASFGKLKLEIYIRSFFRMIFNQLPESGITIQEKLKWLLTKLNTFTRKQWAKVLMLIFGPLKEMGNNPITCHYIPWIELADQSFINNGLEDLGSIVSTLYHYNDYLNIDRQDVFKIFKEIIIIDFPWLRRNIAALLVNSGTIFSNAFLRYKFQESTYEVCTYLIYMNIISSKLDRNFDQVVQMTNELLIDLGEIFVEIHCQTLSNMIFDQFFDIVNFDDEDFEIFDFINPHIHLLRLSFNLVTDDDDGDQENP